jgi:hypothetical protein
MFATDLLRKVTYVTLFLVVLIAFSATPALADDEPPPPPEATEVSINGTTTEVSPTETLITEEAASTEEAVPTETAPQEATPTLEPTDAAPLDQELVTEQVPTETVETEPSLTEGDTETTADLLAELPEGTELVVLDAKGEEVPLASEEAAEILAGGDPIWCPSGVAPKENVGGCSPSFSSMDALVAGWMPTGNGTIWVEDGSLVDAGTEINGATTWAAAASFSLTIQGGWNGVAGSTALDPVDPYTYFDGTDTDWLSIINWVGSVTLKNLVFNSGTYDYESRYETLLIKTSGNIILDKVQVNNTDSTGLECDPELNPPCSSLIADGARLENTTGLGNVVVSNSSFNNNEGYGLIIDSKGTITLKNVSANGNGVGNGYAGATFYNYSAVSAKAVTVSNSTFSGNGGSGLVTLSRGTITLNNVSANLNGGDGVNLQNDMTGAVAGITINGVNSFSGNGGDGAQVESFGAITLSKTTANYNGGDGVFLDNSGAAGYQPVTIAGFFTGIGNGGDGLKIRSRGNVTAAYLTANDNQGSGVSINNSYSGIPKPVLLTGKNTFNGNFYNALVINSWGAITTNNLTAIYNGLNSLPAINLYNRHDPDVQQPVTLNGYNLITDSDGIGLQIYSYGAVTLNNITAVHNYLTGVYIENSGGTYPKAVAIKGTNVFNTSSIGYGLSVFSDGVISVSNITASKNFEGGVYLDNDNSPTAQSNVTITGYGVFEYNGKLDGEHDGAAGTWQVGLMINSQGAITLTNISANHNYGSGAEINTLGITTVHSVTLYGINTFNNNGDSTGSYNRGLNVDADGSITVNKLTAEDNYSNGALLNNQHNTTLQPAVTVNGFSLITGNGWDGMIVWSYGIVTLNNVTSISNAGSGVWIDNNGGSYPKAVTIKGTNTFNNNYPYNGLTLISDGVVTISSITASRNQGVGVWVDNCSWNGASCTGTAQSNVIITGYGLFEYNGKLNGDPGGAAGSTQAGLAVHSHGVVTLANMTANHNYGTGVDIYTVGVTAPHAVTLSGTNTFTFNGDGANESGLKIVADGKVTLNNLTASYNYIYGADIDNTSAAAFMPTYPAGGITVTGFGFIIGNQIGFGLVANTLGSITLNRIVADHNGNGVDDGGMNLNATGNITIVCSSAYGNNGWNLYADAGGIITLKGFISYGGTVSDYTSSTPVTSPCP